MVHQYFCMAIPNICKAAFCYVIIAGLIILNSTLYINVYTSDQTLENIKEIEAEVKKPVTISIKITPGQQAPQLKTSELSKAIEELNSQSLNFTIYEAQYIVSQ